MKFIQLLAESQQLADPPDAPVAGDMNASSFGKRLAGALLCSRRAYAEIAADRGATGHAVAIVLVTDILTSLFGVAESWMSSTAVPPWGGTLFVTMSALTFGLAFTAISALVFRIVAGWFGARSVAFGGWFRMIGFAAPVGALTMIPRYGWVAVQVYSLILYVVATRAVAVTTIRTAIIIGLVAVVGQSLLVSALLLLYGSIGAMIGLLDNPFA